MTDADAVLDGIEVWAMGTMRVELADGKTVNAGKRAPLLARVDRATGRVELYVDEDGLDALTR
ncbi:hypothetical protein [Cellulosimicrobium sp. CpK407]|uniref:hypothetical protein n=1 Tax=Cellulosimicrobium sp. CpK407 TaxID=3229847 RepID=UPI003F3394B1